MTKQEYNKQFDEIMQQFESGKLHENDARIQIINLGSHYVYTVAKRIHGTTQAERE